MPRNHPEHRADTLVVLDFETTGLSPQLGDRPIEIGAVRVHEGAIVDRFQDLMNPGFPVDTFIENYTGITNEMLKAAPPCAEVMRRFADFIGNDNLVAHNASFDRRFLDNEFRLIRRNYKGAFACSMLVARRLYQDAPSHGLESLVQIKEIPPTGAFHRALADSEMTARLWLTMLDDIRTTYHIYPVPFLLMQQLSRKPKRVADRFLRQVQQDQGTTGASP